MRQMSTKQHDYRRSRFKLHTCHEHSSFYCDIIRIETFTFIYDKIKISRYVCHMCTRTRARFPGNTAADTINNRLLKYEHVRFFLNARFVYFLDFHYLQIKCPNQKRLGTKQSGNIYLFHSIGPLKLLNRFITDMTARSAADFLVFVPNLIDFH